MKLYFLLICLLILPMVSALSISSTNADAVNWITSNANISINTYNQTWLDFDGTDVIPADRIDINYNSLFNITDSLTLFAWIKTQNSSKSQEIIYKGSTQYRLRLNTNNLVWFYDGTNPLTSITPILKNQWTNIIFTSNQTKRSIYINGIKDITDAYAYHPTSTSNNNLLIGKWSSAENFNGSIDKIKIYNGSLTDDEAFSLYLGEEILNYNINRTDYFNITNVFRINNGNFVKLSYGGYIKEATYNSDLSNTSVWTNVYNFIGATNEDTLFETSDNISFILPNFEYPYGRSALYRSLDNNMSNWTMVFNFSKNYPSLTTFRLRSPSSMEELNDGSLLLGLYGGKDNGSLIMKSIDKGITWYEVYNGGNGCEGYNHHIHIVKQDPYTGRIYATSGDGSCLANVKLLISDDNGATWNVLKSGNEDGINWQFTGIAFTPDYRIFAEDWSEWSAHNTSRIFITYDDKNFVEVYRTPENYRGYFVDILQDNYGVFYTFTSQTPHNNYSMVLASSNGKDWQIIDKIKYINTSTSGFSSGNIHQNCLYLTNPFQGDGLRYTYEYCNTGKRNSEILNFELNENSGTIAYDSSGNGNNGTISGATWQNDGIVVTNYLSILTNLVISDNLILNPVSWLYQYLISNQTNIPANYVYLENTNPTDTYNLSISGLTSGLVFNTNNSILCGGLVIGDCNITLPPNNSSYVLDEFNLSESSPREYSPIWFSSSSNTEKHIASNLTDTINATVIISVTEQPTSVDYESNTGVFNYTLTNSNWTYDDTSKTITINLTGIEPTISSNVLIITYPQEVNGGDSSSGGSSSGGGSSGNSKPKINVTSNQTKTITPNITIPTPAIANNTTPELNNINKNQPTLFSRIRDFFRFRTGATIGAGKTGYIFAIIFIIMVIAVSVIVMVLRFRKKQLKVSVIKYSDFIKTSEI